MREKPSLESSVLDDRGGRRDDDDDDDDGDRDDDAPVTLSRPERVDSHERRERRIFSHA